MHKWDPWHARWPLAQPTPAQDWLEAFMGQERWLIGGRLEWPRPASWHWMASTLLSGWRRETGLNFADLNWKEWLIICLLQVVSNSWFERKGNAYFYISTMPPSVRAMTSHPPFMEYCQRIWLAGTGLIDIFAIWRFPTPVINERSLPPSKTRPLPRRVPALWLSNWSCCSVGLAGSISVRDVPWKGVDYVRTGKGPSPSFLHFWPSSDCGALFRESPQRSVTVRDVP